MMAFGDTRILLLILSALLSLPSPATADRRSSFNTVLGTQTIGAVYHFTQQTALVETAQAIQQMGSHVIKFMLKADPADTPPPVTLAALVQDDPSIKTVLGMPFANYVLWAYPVGIAGNRFAPQNLPTEYRQMYDLTRVLLRTYHGTGKTFYLGHWEGDWMLLHVNPKDVPTPTEVQNMIAWENNRQKAIDDAKRDTPHQDVQVYGYMEVNRVVDAMHGLVRMTNDVLPHTNIDFVSYSSYDSIGGNIPQALTAALNYIQVHLPPKLGLPRKRVFIGEYGFPAIYHSPEEQDALSRQVMRTGLAWGCPFVLYWEMYNNEVTPDGKQRGFWLIDNHDVKQPLYFTLRSYDDKAQAFLTEFEKLHHRLPTQEEFRQQAVAWLPNVPSPPGKASIGTDDLLKDFSHVDSHTEGLMFDASHPNFFDGRTSRLRRRDDNSPQSLIYRAAHLQTFQLTTYTEGSFNTPAGPKVAVATSTDDVHWHPVALAVSAPIPTSPPSGWGRVILSPQSTLPAHTQYLKITLQNDPLVYSPQLAEVRLLGATAHTAALLPFVLSNGLTLQQAGPNGAATAADSQ